MTYVPILSLCLGSRIINSSVRIVLEGMVEAPISVSVHHGNTLKVARAMAQELGAKVLKPGNIFPEVIRSVSLIDLDSSIYLGAHHRFLIKLVKDNTNLFRDKPVFIFYASIIRKFRLLTGVTKCLSIN